MKKLLVNLGLLLTAILTVFSGLLIQIAYHIGNHGTDLSDGVVLGLEYADWSCLHKCLITLLSLLFVFHVSLHWRWYRTVLAKRLINRNRQVISLTVIFVLVALTGFIPWAIKLFNGSTMLRETFIEIHDKLAIILTIYFILHINKRFKWFISAIEKGNKGQLRKYRYKTN